MTNIINIDFLRNALTVQARPSEIHGVGLFAIIDLPKDTVFLKGGDNEQFFISKVDIERYLGIDNDDDDDDDDYENDNNEECHRVFLKMSEPEKSTYFNNIDGYFVPLHYHKRTITSYINHSENPNVALNRETDSWVTLRHIEKGEELFWNYEHLNNEDIN